MNIRFLKIFILKIQNLNDGEDRIRKGMLRASEALVIFCFFRWLVVHDYFVFIF